jgi:hypothetical protein
MDQEFEQELRITHEIEPGIEREKMQKRETLRFGENDLNKI